MGPPSAPRGIEFMRWVGDRAGLEPRRGPGPFTLGGCVCTQWWEKAEWGGCLIPALQAVGGGGRSAPGRKLAFPMWQGMGGLSADLPWDSGAVRFPKPDRGASKAPLWPGCLSPAPGLITLSFIWSLPCPQEQGLPGSDQPHPYPLLLTHLVLVSG